MSVLLSLAELKPVLVALFGEKGEVWKYSYWQAMTVLSHERDVSRFVAIQGEKAREIAEAKAKEKARRK